MKTLFKLFPLFALIFFSRLATAEVFQVTAEPIASPATEITFADQPMAPRYHIVTNHKISGTDLGEFTENGKVYRVLFNTNTSNSFHDAYQMLFDNIENVRNVPISAAIFTNADGTEGNAIVVPSTVFNEGIYLPISQAYSLEEIRNDKSALQRATYYLYHPNDGTARIILKDKFAD